MYSTGGKVPNSYLTCFLERYDSAGRLECMIGGWRAAVQGLLLQTY